jgi:hypothetical protein
VAAFERLKKIQNDGRCHGNQGAKNVKFTPNNNFTWHMIFLLGFIKFDQGISEKCAGQTFDGRKKERNKNNSFGGHN